jgi:hypothetical protein
VLLTDAKGALQQLANGFWSRGNFGLCAPPIFNLSKDVPLKLEPHRCARSERTGIEHRVTSCYFARGAYMQLLLAK